MGSGEMGNRKRKANWKGKGVGDMKEKMEKYYGNLKIK